MTLAGGKERGRTGEDLSPAEGPRVLNHSAPPCPALLTAAVPWSPPPPSWVLHPPSAATTREARLVAKINTARANHGLPPLRTSPDLMAAARAHSGAMAGQRTAVPHRLVLVDLLLGLDRRERRRRATGPRRAPCASCTPHRTAPTS